MTPDPCWLPSAIMQTMGALLGIYIAVYVLVIKEFLERNIDEGVIFANLAFYIVIIFSSITIIINALWLADLTTNIIKIYLPNIEIYGFFSFIISIAYISVYSIVIAQYFSIKRKNLS